jgi:5-formyltetrahydrofolate cyclo-ligase
MNSWDKKHIRQHLLAQRKSLSPSEWQHRNQALIHQLTQSSLFQKSHTVLVYFSIQQEPDLSQLFTGSFTKPKRWAFPVIEGKSLVIYPWQPGEALVPGSYNIPVPQNQTLALTPEDIDLLCIPCVGMDRRGYRLGYGGGFYDRLRSDPHWQTIPAIGLLFDFALCPHLPHDVWDIPLQGWCTELEVQVL